jgi:hypothetical protein
MRENVDDGSRSELGARGSEQSISRDFRQVQSEIDRVRPHVSSDPCCAPLARGAGTVLGGLIVSASNPSSAGRDFGAVGTLPTPGTSRIDIAFGGRLASRIRVTLRG